MRRWELLGLGLSYVLVVSLALAVTINRHQARQLFLDLQQLERDRDQLNADWSRLTLEQSTRLNQVRVESRAKKELGMQKPSADSIRIIRE
ncbi:MAG: cell division protein FtsL [Thiothrix sp.]|nr:cell division protein FtsL [Thiothrix sp.]